MKKKILFVILSLILACAIFYGGVYLGQKTSPVAESNQSDFYYYFSVPLIEGYGIIKDIDVDSSGITLSSQIFEDKTLKLKINEYTRFHQVTGVENGRLMGDPIELKDLKINDMVYFACRPNQDRSLTLLLLNVKSKESILLE